MIFLVTAKNNFFAAKNILQLQRQAASYWLAQYALKFIEVNLGRIQLYIHVVQQYNTDSY